jgi:prepilin-type N-terminal cleavage/methylation domain-containing protein
MGSTDHSVRHTPLVLKIMNVKLKTKNSNPEPAEGQISKIGKNHFDFLFLNFTLRNGFTLVELLIVVGIIGILLAVSSTAYTLAQRRSRDARRISDMKAIQSAFEQYASDNNGQYPNATADVTATYLPIGIPLDPKTKTEYASITFDGTALTVPPQNYSYCACVALEMTTGGNASNGQCAFATRSSYYCVRDIQ